jgi:hypothetical protein
MTTGYRHVRYVESFVEIGQPRNLSACGGWLIERTIPGSEQRDAMGCYPLFDCDAWERLPIDLAGMAGDLVCVTLVSDPFAAVSEADLRQWFDVVIPYKQHYVTDLMRTPEDIVQGQHRRNTRTAMRRVEVAACEMPMERLDEWCELYGHLIERHGISGLRAFSRAAFEKQLGVPGLTMLRASVDGETVGLHLWYECDEVAYGHLGATSERGYEHMAAYALYWNAIQYFRDRVRWLDLGASPGVSAVAADDGLSRFKAGWATDTRPTFVCGRVLQPTAYAELAMKAGTTHSRYFPSYRHSEFASTDAQLAPELD